MHSIAADYYSSGEYNCSQCILKAAMEKYNLNITDEQFRACSAVNNGFGTGGICCVLLAAIMVFGMMFDEEKAKRLRIYLLTEFYSRYRGINCGCMKGFSTNCKGCLDIIDNVWNIMEYLIDYMK